MPRTKQWKRKLNRASMPAKKKKPVSSTKTTELAQHRELQQKVSQFFKTSMQRLTELESQKTLIQNLEQDIVSKDSQIVNLTEQVETLTTQYKKEQQNRKNLLAKIQHFLLNVERVFTENEDNEKDSPVLPAVATATTANIDPDAQRLLSAVEASRLMGWSQSKPVKDWPGVRLTKIGHKMRITGLILRNSNITIPILKSLCDKLPKSLQILDLSHNTLGNDIREVQFPLLEELNLGWNNIHDDGVSGFTPPIGLKTLILSGNKISHNGVKQLLLPHTLQILHLDENFIGDIGAKNIANILYQNEELRLEVLQIHDNNISEQVGNFLKAAFRGTQLRLY